MRLLALVGAIAAVDCLGGTHSLPRNRPLAASLAPGAPRSNAAVMVLSEDGSRMKRVATAWRELRGGFGRSVSARLSPDESAPSSLQVQRRHYLVRRLIQLDAEGLAQRFARLQPWGISESMQDELRALESRSPLLQWTFRHQGPLLGATGIKLALGTPSARVPALADLQAPHGERCEELKAALRSVYPLFFELVADAAAADRSAAPRLYRRVASALTTLGTWRASIFLKLSARWRYGLMNAFLRQLIVVMSDCQAVLEDREELLLRCDAESCDAEAEGGTS